MYFYFIIEAQGFSFHLLNIIFLTGYRSAFAIYYGNPTYSSSTGILRFSATRLNKNYDYSTSTGQFTCEYPGIYVFVLNIFTKSKYGSSVGCHIRRNSGNVAWAMAQGYSKTNENGGSGSAIIDLYRGDKVYVGKCSGTSNIGQATSFIGFLLRAD